MGIPGPSTQAVSGVREDTLVTVSHGIQSVQMPWSSVANSFAHSPYMADRIRSELERDGVSHHEDFGFFLPKIAAADTYEGKEIPGETK